VKAVKALRALKAVKTVKTVKTVVIKHSTSMGSKPTSNSIPAPL